MSDVARFLSENSAWLFGSGGAAAFVLALLKIFKRGGGGGPKPGTVPHRDNTTSTTTIKVGVGPIEYGIGLAIIVTAIGGVLWFASPDRNVNTQTTNVDNNSANVQGNGNTTLIIGGKKQ